MRDTCLVAVGAKNCCCTPCAVELPLPFRARGLSFRAPAPILLFPLTHRMSWLSRMLGGKSDDGLKPQRLDYLNEALALERQGDFDAALTSYRLALRDHPNDPRILQNMAIAFSRTGRLEEAVRAYRRALDLDPQLSGAHYGLAFLQLKRGDVGEATSHLNAFLNAPPAGAEAERWVRHARQTLDQITTASVKQPESPGAPEA